jgi:predicted transcriptional regulator
MMIPAETIPLEFQSAELASRRGKVAGGRETMGIDAQNALGTVRAWTEAMTRTVSDIMTRNVLTLSAEADLKDAAWGLTLKGFSGAPVKDDSGQVIGILSKSDLIDPEKVDSNPNGHGTVRDNMTPLLLTAQARDPLRSAVRRMVDKGIHRLVVVDERGDVVGIVTPMDVLRALLEGLIQADDFAKPDE